MIFSLANNPLAFLSFHRLVTLIELIYYFPCHISATSFFLIKLKIKNSPIRLKLGGFYSSRNDTRASLKSLASLWLPALLTTLTLLGDIYRFLKTRKLLRRFWRSGLVVVHKGTRLLIFENLLLYFISFKKGSAANTCRLNG